MSQKEENSTTPLAVPFATQNSHYIYDVVTNRVFYAPQPSYLILERLRSEPREVIEADLAPQYGAAEVQACYDRVVEWTDKEGAFFSSNSRPNETLTEENYWRSLLRELGINQLFLVVTENCNLRCRYCIFSDSYEIYRQHNAAVMDFATAKRAIDYYRDLHREIYIPDKIAFINFYGGEPLLHFDFIKDCVAYAKSIEESNVNFRFSITTNATLATQEHVDFFVDNNFYVVVSLDGPESVHDRNRVFANGRGTYDRVMHTLEMFRTKDPEYYRHSVMLSTVYSEGTDLVAVNDFFVEYKDVLPAAGVLSPQRHGSRENGDHKKELTEYHAQQTGELLRRFRHTKIGRADHETVFLDRVAMGVRMLADRDYARSDQLMRYTSNCLPGTKIAVRPDGTFHMCERINEHFPIGDVENGLDLQRIRQVVERYQQQVVDAQDCASCVAQRFCPVCYAQACEEGDFDASILCKTYPDLLKAQLAYLWSILEESPNAFYELASRPRVVELLNGC